jgi:hypothetical protein
MKYNWVDFFVPGLVETVGQPLTNGFLDLLHRYLSARSACLTWEILVGFTDFIWSGIDGHFRNLFTALFYQLGPLYGRKDYVLVMTKLPCSLNPNRCQAFYVETEASSSSGMGKPSQELEQE